LKANIINIYFFFNDFVLNIIQVSNMIVSFYFNYINFFNLKKLINFQLSSSTLFSIINLSKNYNYISLITRCLKNKN
jgi:hypothetical protein